MSSKLNGHIETAKDFVHTAQEGTTHLASNARGRFADGMHVVGGVLAMLRGLGMDDALGWIGLSRRRGFMTPLVAFGAGAVAGLGVGMLFAPKTGADARRQLLSYLSGVEKSVEKMVDKTEATVAKTAGKVESTVEHGADAMKDAAKSRLESVTVHGRHV